MKRYTTPFLSLLLLPLSLYILTSCNSRSSDDILFEPIANGPPAANLPAPNLPAPNLPAPCKSSAGDPPSVGYVVIGEKIQSGQDQSGQESIVIISDDGIKWELVEPGDKSKFRQEKVAYGNGIFMIVGTTNNKGNIATSSDGKSWQSKQFEGSGFSTVAFANNQFVMVGGSNIGGSNGGSKLKFYILAPPYTSATSEEIGDDRSSIRYSGITYGGGKFVFVTNRGINVRTSKGAYKLATTPSTSVLNATVHCKNEFVAVGGGGTIMTSAAGDKWIKASIKPGLTGTISLKGVTYGAGKFVAVGENGTILTSADGKQWSVVQSKAIFSSDYLIDIAYGNKKFVVVTTSRILTSPDGLTWTARYSNSELNIFDIAARP